MAVNIPESNLPRVVVIGGGFGGINVANKLRRADVQLIMLDRNNHHTFQPLLYQVATSGLEAGSIAYPLRKLLTGKNYHFRMAEVQQVLPAENKIKTSLGEINYDYLILATGSKTNFFGMKDLEENALSLKSVSQAIDMRHIILQNFENMLCAENAGERQRLMNFAIAGGGPTGVELAGALSELRKKVLPKDYPELDFSQMRIMILDPGDKVLASMSPEASKYAEKYLEDFGVKLKFGCAVKSYDGKNAVLSTGEILPTSTLIWAAGVTGDIPEGLDKTIIARGNRILVDEFNRVRGHENIFAIGDIAQHETPEEPRGLPMLAPVAIQQGAHLAKNIKKLIKKEKIEPFKYFDKGSMATVGRMKAVVDLTKKIHFGGFFAWIAWLFVHLLYLIGFRNKLMVFTDWVWNYFTFDRRVRLIIRPVQHKKPVVPAQEPGQV